MAENLNSNSSDWKVGESNPKEFTADAVVDVVKTAEKEEVERIGNAERYGDDDERSTVIAAVDSRYSELNESSDDADSDDSDDSDSDDSDDGVVDYSELDPKDEKYTPYQDPAVGSSALADVIVLELEGVGKSPTLEACRSAYKEAQKNKG